MKKFLKRVICAMLVAMFMFANSNIVFAGDYIVFSTDIIEPELHNTASNGSFDNLEAYIGDIDEFQKYILNCLMTDDSNLQSGTNQGYIDVSKYNIPYNDYTSVELSRLIWYESPELFRIDSIGYSYTVSGKIVSLIPHYRISSAEDFKQQHDVFVEVSEKMLDGIKGNYSLNDEEKALLLHDRLIEYCEYDNENLRNNTVPDSSYSAQGVFCYGTAVCMGYTLAYDYLLEQVGIEAEYCSSRALNHAWNIVYIDNNPYYVDVTWDDPVWDVSGRVNHDNFLVSPEVFKESHNATDYKVISSYTTYDDAFWQNSNTAFQLINNKIYYVDNVKQKLYGIDDITDTEPETIASLDYKWTTADGAYWGENYSKLASIRDNLFYSTPTEIYKYNPEAKTSEVIIDNEDIYETIGLDGYRIYGMTAVGCILWGEFAASPIYTAETKRTYYFAEAYHNPEGNWQTVIEPTSSSQGKEVNICIDCGSEVGARLIPALDDQHIWTEWYVDPNNKPTCTDKGVELRDCSHCDAFEWRYGTALGHDYSADFTVEAQPTCGIDGVKYRVCSRCDAKVDITNIPATGKHILTSNWVTGKVATCGSEGYEYKSCTSCGVEVEKRTIAKLPHGDTEVVNIKSATCSVEGYTGDTRCKICKTVITYGEKIDALSHTSSEWIIKIKPTTLTDGLRYKKCTVCDIELEREVIPATKHRFDNGVVKIPATCTQDGERIYTCAKCGETKIEVIEATGHKEVVIPAVAPTYSSVGKTEGKKCSVCNEILVAQKDVAKLVLGVPKVTQKNTEEGISLTWGKVENAESYRVYRRTYNTKTKKYSEWTTLSKAQKGTSFVDTKVKLGTTYSYRVKAINSGVLSKGTPTKNLKYNVTPTVTVANASKGISVSWSPIANATGYEVYSSTYNAKTKKWSSFTKRATAKENAKSWTDTKAKSGTKYKYTVKALNGKVASEYNKSGVQIVRLAQPTTKIVNASNGIKVSWGKVSGATSYEILRAEYNAKTKKWNKAKKVATAKSSATSWTDTKVKSGVQYRYTVKAVNGKIYSSAKTTSGLMFLTMPKPTVKAVKTGITVTWTQSTGATSYEVYRAEYNKKTKKYTAFKKVSTAKSTAKSYTDKTAKKGVKYKYTVKAVNGKVASAYKEVVVSR